MRVKVLSQISELESIAAKWNQLLASHGGTLLPLTYEWFKAWHENFAAGKEIRIHCVYAGDRLVAIAPFYLDSIRYRTISTRVMQLMANGHSPYCDIVCQSGLGREAHEEILRAILSVGTSNITRFGKLPDTSPFFEILLDYSRNGEHHIGIKENLTTPLIVIDGDWDNFYAERPRKFRKSINNKLNRVEKEGGFHIENETIESAESEPFEIMMRISANSWKAQHGRDLATSPGSRAFLAELTSQFSRRGEVHVWIMYQNDTPIAFEYHIMLDGVTYPMRADFDEGWRHYSPGSILEYSILKQLFENSSVDTYDSCAGDYWYLSNWTGNYRKQCDFEIFGNSFKSLFLHNIEYRAIPVLRAVRDRFVTGN